MSTAVICPGCRTLGDDGRLDLRTLDADPTSPDVLVCVCGCRYPIVDGVPIVCVPGRLTLAVEHDLAPEAARLVAGGPDDTPDARLLEHLSIYLDAQWGDRADPPPEPRFGLAAIVERLADLPRVAAAVELGCSVGRVVGELARRADHVVGFDLQLAAVRRARKLLAGETLAYDRRVVGTHYTSATITGERADNITLFCGDALDPPLVPRSYDRVVALNLLDSVANPRQILSVADGLCDQGGELILASPFAWQSAITAPAEQLGGADPAATLRAILVEGLDLSARYEIVEQLRLPWTLRRDARTTVAYQVDYLRARKS